MKTLRLEVETLRVSTFEVTPANEKLAEMRTADSTCLFTQCPVTM
ncbi:hypothetical protein [Longimicrobium sp.]|nr:hypothetical protein [Longimicrobium sp.]HSU17253.1 hypothetical protein [Longimicrobium sp.]